MQLLQLYAIIGLMYSGPSLFIANYLYDPMTMTGHNYRNTDVL